MAGMCGVLLTAATAGATHATACGRMPTTGTRAVSVSCNPRQECLNAAQGNPAAGAACRTLPEQGTCPHTETFNPRSECVAALPAPPPFSINNMNFDVGAGTVIHPGDSDTLVVRGANVGVPGVTVGTSGGGFTATITGPRVGGGQPCVPPNCVRVEIRVGNVSPLPATRSFTLKSADGHRTANASISIAEAPPQRGMVRQPPRGSAQSSSGSPASKPACVVTPNPCPTGKTFDMQNCRCI